MVAATVTLLVTTPVAMWWLVGDRTEVPAELDPDYMVEPLAVDPVAAGVVGAGCVVTAGVVLLLVTWVTLRHRSQRPWWSVMLSVLVVGYIVGVGFRAMTTGTIGANIGAGVMVGVCGPAVVMLLLWAVVRSIELVRSGRLTGRR
jgi:hypothetical protein